MELHTYSPEYLLNCAIIEIEDSGLSRSNDIVICRKKAEHFISILKEYDLTTETCYCKCLLYFPDLLEEFIIQDRKHNIDLTKDNIMGSLNWYIENIRNNIPDEACDVILKYYPSPLQLMLIPQRWSVDIESVERYNKLVSYGFYSCSMDKSMPYKPEELYYKGYRYTLYLLCYGTQEHINDYFATQDCEYNCRGCARDDYIKGLENKILPQRDIVIPL